MALVVQTLDSVACVAGAWKKWAQEKTGAREGDTLACLPRARPFSLSPATSKRLLRRLWFPYTKRILEDPGTVTGEKTRRQFSSGSFAGAWKLSSRVFSRDCPSKHSRIASSLLLPLNDLNAEQGWLFFFFNLFIYFNKQQIKYK